MNVLDAKKLALELMAEHGLDGWTFEFDSAERRFGCCKYGTKTISLSRPLTELNDEASVRDCLLHEIAHALAGRAEGHGPVWKCVAQSLGCSATRCYDEMKVVQTPPRWIGRCPNCSKEVGRKVLFKEARTLACGACCKKLNAGRHSREFVLEWRENR